MTESIETQTGSEWQRFLRKHSAAFAVFIAAAILVAVGAVYVFIWFTGNSQTTGIVPSTIGQWSMNNMLLFILHAIFWELVLIGIPVAIGAIIGWQWWKRIPEAEKPISGKHSKRRSAGGAISPLLMIAFAIKVYVDGNWNAAIAGFSLDYIVDSMVTILIYIAAIFAIPATIALIWWVSRGRHKS